MELDTRKLLKILLYCNILFLITLYIPRNINTKNNGFNLFFIPIGRSFASTQRSRRTDWNMCCPGGTTASKCAGTGELLFREHEPVDQKSILPNFPILPSPFYQIFQFYQVYFTKFSNFTKSILPNFPILPSPFYQIFQFYQVYFTKFSNFTKSILTNFPILPSLFYQNFQFY